MDTDIPSIDKTASLFGSIGNTLFGILNTMDNAWDSIDDRLESIDSKLERMADAAELQALLAFDASGIPSPSYESDRAKIAELMLRITGVVGRD